MFHRKCSKSQKITCFLAHKDQPCRGISFSPTDVKFASCSDDGTVRIWDFYTRTEEKILRGHGADVKQCDWHPSKGIVASGSKARFSKFFEFYENKVIFAKIAF